MITATRRLDLFKTTAVSVLALIALSQAGAARGQAIERNLPPAPPTPATPVLAPNATPSDQDDRPIGPTLSGLLLLGPGDPARADPIQGVNTALVARLNVTEPRAELDAFLGKPLSRKLIARIEATIARYYRHNGYPFISISTPPQTIGAGMLQVRVVEFHAGAVSVTGVKAPAADHIRRDVRLQTDQSIDAVDLTADLDWLNRYPFRHAEAVFSPGDTLGRSNLDLQVTLERPWQVYAGYANSGSPSTGWDRYYLGGQVGGLLGPGSLASYQFTASPDFFDDHGDAFGDTSHPRYLSHGVRVSIPTGARQEFEATFDHVETNIFADPFMVRQQTDELSVGYRTSMSNFVRLPGDIFTGLELKTEKRTTFFDGADVLNKNVNVYQLYGGWANAWSDIGGHNAFNLVVHGSPGGVDIHNNDDAFATFSNGRVTSSDYVYATAQFNRTTRLPGGWTVTNALIGQYAGSALPDTEQMGVGGPDLVRGYTLDDGSYDSAIVSRNELRTPTFPLLGARGFLADQLSPYAFVDAAYGSSRAVKVEVHPTSVGLGADYQLTAHLAASAAVAYDLSDGLRTQDGVRTHDGDWLLQSRVTLSY
ncbi:MAG TPA: ShlB/FhaC/HecB family hemolysin secretion/activation protein [Caulobacteraceae bacterium]|nr:ShlB/FhaC/HecB family hemolysin secretion/activation protein [Caulobacteraceae bacterium]